MSEPISDSLTAQIAPWKSIMGFPVADLGYAQCLALLERRISKKAYTPVTFLNAHNANVAIADHKFARAMQGFLVLSDGIGVDIASRVFHGAAFKANLNGTDLVPALFSFITKPLKVALLGARPQIIQRACETFEHETPWHEFHVISDGYFREQDVPDLKAKLTSLKPDVLLVAMGVPRQEQFIIEQLGPDYCTMPMAIGALLDLHSGAIPRAPLWVRQWRCEWAYRLTREPDRLWRRYILGNPQFLLRVGRDWLAGRSRQSGAPQQKDWMGQEGGT